MPSQRFERGQASVDYTALLATVGVLLGALAALLPGGARGMVNAVRAQTTHALCVVTGKACRLDRTRPCAIAMRRESRRYGITIGFVRLDKDRFVMRELMSDGTVRMTLIKRFSGGLQLGAGARAQIEQDLRSGGLNGETNFSGQGVWGGGKVFVARDAAEAVSIMRAIADGDDPPVPVSESFVDGGVRGLASLATGGAMTGVEFETTAPRLLSVRRNHRTGARTIAFNLGASGSALAGSVIGGPAASLDATATFGLTFDRRRRPVELSLLAFGNLVGGARLPKLLATVLALNGNQHVPANLGGRRWEFAARVDLADHAVAAAWKRFRGSPTSLAAMAGLAQALRERAHFDARMYRARNSSNGTSVGIALGLKFGAETEHAIERFSLLAASSRPPGGLWEPRMDCV